MKYIIILIAILGLQIHTNAQEQVKPDHRPQSVVQDPLNIRKAEDVTKVDILEALEMTGVYIHKIDIGAFHQKNHLTLKVEEWHNGKKLWSELLYDDDNLYTYQSLSDAEYYRDYLQGIRIIAKNMDDNAIKISIRIGDLLSTRIYQMQKSTEPIQFFEWRKYRDTHWKLNKEVPLAIYASSWKDPKYDIYRFCGTLVLGDNDADTKELLESSPNYLLFTLTTTEIKD